MIAWLRRTLLVVVVLTNAVLVGPRVVAAADADAAVGNGRFYPQAGGAADVGYALTDDDGVRLWRDFGRLGGVAVLGYPSSERYAATDGFVYQATQAALLQWRPAEDRTALANTFDMLSTAGKDEWLRVARGIPPPIPDDGSRGNWDRAVVVRIGWLDDPAIRERYLANPNPAAFPDWSMERAIALYGLPTSRPVRVGPFVAQRFQRVAFQRWVDAVPGMPAVGTVVPVLGGDLLKEAGLLPPASIRPQSYDAVAGRVDPALRVRLDLLGTAPAGAPLRTLALEQRLAMVWVPLPETVGAFYSPSRRWIAVNTEWRDADPRAVAALLGHELTHAQDAFAGKPIGTAAGCFASEEAAFRAQAAVWETFYGAGGKTGKVSGIEEQHNTVLALVRRGADALHERVVRLYQRECAERSD
jgi:hypothetical protein